MPFELISHFNARRIRLRWWLAVLLMISGCAANIDDGSAVDVDSEALSLAPTLRWSVSNAGGPVAFSPDGASVATAAFGMVQTLATATGAQLKTYDIRGSANAVAFSRDGSLLATGSSSSPLNLRVFRVADGTQIFNEKAAHNNGVTSIAFSPTDPTLFATGGRDKTVANTKLWNTQGNVVRSFNDGRRVLALAYSPDGKTIASNASGSIHVWRVSDGALLLTITSVNQFAVAYSPDGTKLTTGYELFNATTGALIRRFAWPSGGDISGVTFNKDGTVVIAGGEDFPNNVDVATIRYFRVSDGAVLVTYNKIGGMNAYVQSIAISPDGKSLAYGVATDGVTALAASPF